MSCTTLILHIVLLLVYYIELIMYVLRVHSPGFWRMQVEHLCSHLRAYSQGSVDFQNSIGSAQIGKVKIPASLNRYTCAMDVCKLVSCLVVEMLFR